MPKYTLHYFPIKALGEGIRMLLAYGGEEFEDIRIPKTEWPEFKPSTPFGQMPVLEFDGKKVAQTFAIGRYLGHKYGLAGKDLDEDLEIDQNVDFFNDIRLRANTVFLEKDEKIADKRQADFDAEYYPELLKKLDEIITKNNGYLALGKLTWADFIFAGNYDCFKMILRKPDLDKQYPSFKKLHDKVVSIAKVKAYLDKAPKHDW